MAALNGNTGNITGNGILGTLNTWSATISRTMSDVTGFADTGRNRLLGLWDMTGSAGGVLDSTAGFVTTNQPAAMTAISGALITLQARSSGTSQNTIQANVVVDSIAMASTKNADATITFNFNLAHTGGTNLPFTIVWTT